MVNSMVYELEQMLDKYVKDAKHDNCMIELGVDEDGLLLSYQDRAEQLERLKHTIDRYQKVLNDLQGHDHIFENDYCIYCGLDGRA